MRNEKIQLIINDIRSSLPLYLLIFCQLLLVFYVVSSGCDFLSEAGNGTAAQDISYDGRNDNYYGKSRTFCEQLGKFLQKVKKGGRLV